MKNVLFIIMIALFVVSPAVAQEQVKAEELALTKIINSIFKNMKESNSAAIKPFFHESAQMQTFVPGPDNKISKLNSPEGWWAAIDKYQEQEWDERVWDLQFNIHENLAQVQMNFAFYRDGEFSHCGENSFQFIKIGDNWKIIYIIDSRKASDCEIPDEIENR